MSVVGGSMPAPKSMMPIGVIGEPFSTAFAAVRLVIDAAAASIHCKKWVCLVMAVFR
jgi:hypothetical protein